MPATGKVLMVIENCSVPADSRVWAEATALKEHGFDVAVIGPKGESYDLEEYMCLESIQLYRYHAPVYATHTIAYLWEYGLSMLKTWWLSLRVLREHNFDVIHAANPPDTFFFLAWFYRFLGKRFIFDQHDLSPEMFRVKFGGRSPFLHKVLLWLEKRSYRASALVITTNLSQKQVAITRGKCDPEKVFVVRNGPNLQRLYRVPPEPELKGGRPFLLAYIGAMEIQDGIDYALRAMYELVHVYGRRDVSFVLMGDGGQLPALKALAHELEIEEYVNFTGWVGDQDIVRYLSTADIGICPDPQNGLNEYCTMVKSMEYMAMSLPVVAFDLAETRHTAQDAALYATPNSESEFADHLMQLLENGELRAMMGKRARSLIEERLSWDYDKRNLLLAYSTLFPQMTTFNAPPANIDFQLALEKQIGETIEADARD
jgi:glycosyltransferase involved in cell wall biosynthesis